MNWMSQNPQYKSPDMERPLCFAAVLITHFYAGNKTIIVMRKIKFSPLRCTCAFTCLPNPKADHPGITNDHPHPPHPPIPHNRAAQSSPLHPASTWRGESATTSLPLPPPHSVGRHPSSLLL